MSGSLCRVGLLIFVKHGLEDNFSTVIFIASKLLEVREVKEWMADCENKKFSAKL